jgi:4-diphosphocytidyl-2-C-methyl-D-erythritol kinase
MPQSIEQISPAKINLYLEVKSKRKDNFHNIESFITFVEYGDLITISKSDSLKLKITGDFAKELSESDNIIVKAVKGLEKLYNRNFDVSIDLCKKLPISSGMGGGSSNAATVVRCIHKLFNIKEKKNLDDFLISIGADVPFCFHGKSAIVTGLGDKLNYIEHDFEKFCVLLINPLKEVSTKRIFEKLNLQHRSLVEANIDIKKISLDFIKKKSNHLENSAIEELEIIKKILDFTKNQTNNLLVRMTGSGATCFAIYRNIEDLRVAENRIKSQFKKCWLQDTNFINSINDINLV